MTMPRYSSRAMSQPASTSTRRTVWPSGPVWIVTSLWPSRVAGDFGGFFGGANELHAVLLGVVFDRAFAAAAGVDLGLHDGERAAQLLERGGGFVGRGGDDVLRHGDAGFAQQLFGLVFVNFHAGYSGKCGELRIEVPADSCRKLAKPDLRSGRV